MPRTARASAGGVVYHVINRGNDRGKLFHKPGDYDAFLKLIELACRRIPMRVLAICLMPNHIHLVLWPHRDGDLSRWMQWLLTAHVRRFHRHHGTSGHVWQGRFKAFPVQEDHHLLVLLRYVERNALRARLVERAEAWRWASASMRMAPRRDRAEWLSDSPVPLPRNWPALLNEPQSDAEARAVRHSIQRGTPLGEPSWQKKIAKRLGLEPTLNPIGRPRKVKK